ncbi:hypothetical protein VSS76_13405 [Bacillus safensis]|uniref:hypothetical protein n=1 Tax=Bacillus safensis TaxID=561879 RepID=UPI002DD450B4|nr:hypothetical protein [Bacillus safensis]MEC4588270.1 hypothetical protein [Bacillus safensis]MEC4628963.1 hypothetical protein [Bacillus safensis]
MSIEIYENLKELEKAYTGFHETKTYSSGTVYVEAEQLAITIYENSLIVHTLDNAIKRGKTVIKHTVHFQKGSFEGMRRLDQ